MFQDTKFSFLDHLKIVFEKTNKTKEFLRKVQLVLPRSSLLIIYKSFVRLHLDYGDTIYEQACNTAFHEKMEAVQYNAALAINRCDKKFL